MYGAFTRNGSVSMNVLQSMRDSTRFVLYCEKTCARYPPSAVPNK